VTVLFSDLEGRLHMLDYDKSFSLRAGQFDVLTLLDPWIYRATRKRPAAGHGLGVVLLGASGCVWIRQVLVFGHVIDKDGFALLR